MHSLLVLRCTFGYNEVTMATLQTSSSATQVRTQAKESLARLMATENLTIVHQPSAPTAYFNTKTRTLTLPVFKQMSGTMYDLLVSHEVGHALYTPSEEAVVIAAMDKIDATNHAVVHDYLNVVEDARIERLMRGEFPGLARTFAKGYGEMLDGNFFGKDIASKIDTLPLIDRLNIHYKPGLYGYMQVAFTDEEQCFVDMMGKTKSFDDVVDVACEIYDFVTQPKNNPQQQPPQTGKGNPQKDCNDGESDDQSDEGKDEGKGEGQTEGGSQVKGDKGEKQDDIATPTMESENGENEMEQSGNGDQSKDESKDQSKTVGDSQKGGSSTPKQPAPMSETMNASKDEISKMRDMSAVAPVNMKVPTLNLDAIIVDYKRISKDLNDCRIRHSASANTVKLYDKFAASNKEYVNTLVREFERKMSADESRRTFVSRSGSLDMSRIHSYKFSDDLFLKTTNVTSGKNHGMVMFIDWSGSMSRTLEKTVHQLMNLIAFCNALRIPFEVYAFSSYTSIVLAEKQGTTNNGSNMHAYYSEQAQLKAALCKEYTIDVEPLKDGSGTISTCKTGEFLNMANFSLLNLCSSRMSKKEMRDGLINLIYLGKNHGSGNVPSYMWLGGTPLDEAVIAAMQIVPAFRAASKTQIVNTIFLTDGSGCSNPMGQSSSPVILRTASGHTYRWDCNVQDGTSFLRSVLRSESKSSVTGFFLTENANHAVYGFTMTSAERNIAQKSMTENHHMIITDKLLGYDNFFVIDSTVKGSTNKDTFGGTLEQSFMKGASEKKSTRAILTKFTDCIAKDFVY